MLAFMYIHWAQTSRRGEQSVRTQEGGATRSHERSPTRRDGVKNLTCATPSVQCATAGIAVPAGEG